MGSDTVANIGRAALTFAAVYSGGASLAAAGWITAASTALSYHQQQATRKRFQSLQESINNAAGRDRVFRQPIPVASTIYGEPRVAGPLIYLGTRGTNDKWVDYAFVVADHDVEYLSFWLNDEALDLTEANPFDPSDPQFLQRTPKSGPYKDKIYISAIDGTQTTAFSQFNAFPGWGANHVGFGWSYVVVTTLNDSNLFGQLPANVSCVVRGKRCLDPRTNQMVRTTNPALIAYDHARSSGGLAYEEADIDITSIQRNANHCEIEFPLNVDPNFSNVSTDFTVANNTISTTAIPINTLDRVYIGPPGTITTRPVGTANGVAFSDGAGNIQLATTKENGYAGVFITLPAKGTGWVVARFTEQSYTFNGTVSSATQPVLSLAAMLQSMNADFSDTGGQFTLISDAVNGTAVLELTDDDLIGSLQVVGKSSRSDRFNSVKGTFFSPFNFYQVTEFPEESSASAITADGSKIYHDIALENTVSSSMAKRIARSILTEHRNEIIVNLNLNFSGLGLTVGDVVSITNSNYGFNRKKFTIVNWRFNMAPVGDGFVPAHNLTLRETPISRPWNPATDEVRTIESIAPPTTTPNAPLAAPIGMSFAEEYVNGVINLRVSWTTLDDTFTNTYGFEFKKTADSTYQTISIPSTSKTHLITNVEGNTSYDVRVRAFPSSGTPSNYLTRTYVVRPSTVRPPDIIDFTVDTLPSGVKLIDVNLTNRPADFSGVDISYSADHSLPFAQQTVVRMNQPSFPIEVSNIPAGSLRFGARMRNRAGLVSQNVRYKVIRTLAAPMGTTLLSRSESALNFNGTIGTGDVRITSRENGPQWVVGMSTRDWRHLPNRWRDLADRWIDLVYSSDPISYSSQVIDLGSRASFTAIVDVDFNGTLTSFNLIHGNSVNSSGAIVSPTVVALTDDTATANISARYIQISTVINPIQATGVNAVLKEIRTSVTGTAA